QRLHRAVRRWSHRRLVRPHLRTGEGWPHHPAAVELRWSAASCPHNEFVGAGSAPLRGTHALLQRHCYGVKTSPILHQLRSTAFTRLLFPPPSSGQVARRADGEGRSRDFSDSDVGNSKHLELRPSPSAPLRGRPPMTGYDGGGT